MAFRGPGLAVRVLPMCNATGVPSRLPTVGDGVRLAGHGQSYCPCVGQTTLWDMQGLCHRLYASVMPILSHAPSDPQYGVLGRVPPRGEGGSATASWLVL